MGLLTTNLAFKLCSCQLKQCPENTVRGRGLVQFELWAQHHAASVVGSATCSLTCVLSLMQLEMQAQHHAI
eukprot:1157320-Pelagomonas_calceolata.AAC.6